MNELQLTIRATVGTYDQAKSARVLTENVVDEIEAVLARHATGTFLIKERPVIGITYAAPSQEK